MRIKELIKTPMLLRAEDLLNDLEREELLFLDMHLNINLDGFDKSVSDKITEISFDIFKNTYKSFASKRILKEKKSDLIKRILPHFGDGLICAENISILNVKSKAMVLIYGLIQNKIIPNDRASIEEMVNFLCDKMCSPTIKSTHTYNIISICVAIDFLSMSSSINEKGVMSFIGTCLTGLFTNYTFLVAGHFKKISVEQNNMSKKLNKNSKEIEKLKELNSTLRKTKVDYENQCKLLISEKEDKAQEFDKILESIRNGFNDVNSNYEKIIKEAKETKSSAEASAYKNEVDRLTTQVSDLKVTIKEKNAEIKELKKELDIIIMDKSTVTNKTTVVVKEGEVNTDVKPVETPAPKKNVARFDYNKHRIGYATIENGIHYVNFVDNNLPKKSPIYNIPLEALIHKKQFVKVNEKYEFVYAFHNIIEDNENGLEDIFLGSVNTNTYAHGDEVSVSIHGKSINVESNGRKSWLKANTIVGIDKFDRITKTFRTTRLLADNVIDSANAKAMKLMYVMQVLGNNLVVRNINEVGNDEIINVDLNNNKVIENSIIMVVNNKVIRCINSPKFYNNSKFYPQEKLELATVEFIDGNALAKKVNTSELVMIKNIPPATNLKQGEIITLDEFNNLAYINDEKNLINKVSQIANSKKKLDDKEPVKAPKITSKVLILGNPSYKNNYKQAFAKEGYDTVTIDGIMRNTFDIERESKDVEFIVCVKNHTSHSNFWFVKDDLPKRFKKVYTPLSVDGANRLVDMVKNYSLYVNE